MRIFVAMFCSLLVQTISEGAVVYGLSSPFDGDSGTYQPSQLFQFSLDGSSFNNLGPVLLDGAGADLDGLAALQGEGVFAFQSTPAGSRLVRIDVSALTATVLAPPLFGREIRGATITETGWLWAVDASSDQLIRVSTSTGEELEAVSLTLEALPFDVPATVDLATDFSGQLLLVASNSVYEVNATNGELSSLFVDGEGEPVPASLLPPNAVGAVVGLSGTEQLLAFDVEGVSTDDIYTYDLSNNFSRSLFLAAPIPQVDSSMGDLALLLQPVESGDYNGDGRVNAADYTVWRDSVGSTSVLAANGVDAGFSMSLINDADYEHWIDRFGNVLGSGSLSISATPVPEPTITTLCMLLLFACRLKRWSRRES